MLSKYRILLTLLVSYIICDNLATSQTLPTTSRPKAPATTTTKKPLSKCYQTFLGQYSGKQYNISLKIPCTTSCMFYKETKNNQDTELGGLCDEDLCLGGLFIVQNNYSVRYDCCDSELCNTMSFSQARLNYNCEFNRKPTRKVLTFPVFKQPVNQVRQCYYCDQCASPKSARIVNCADRNSSVTTFSCQFAYVDAARASFWNADCYSEPESFFLSYEKKNTRVASCQSNLCNSPLNMLKLLNATLCPDGFYT